MADDDKGLSRLMRLFERAGNPEKAMVDDTKAVLAQMLKVQLDAGGSATMVAPSDQPTFCSVIPNALHGAG